MRRTKTALINFLKNFKDFKDFKNYNNKFHELADILIREGWVELDEPREFWIVESLNGDQYVYESYIEASQKKHDICPQLSEIIHVREVEK